MGGLRDSLSQELEGVLDVAVVRIQFMGDGQLCYRAGVIGGLGHDQAEVLVKQRPDGALAAKAARHLDMALNPGVR